jgi:hypothetical protein
MDQVFVIPSPPGGEDYSELALAARPRQARGTVFRKHILNLGTLFHPKTGEPIALDEPWFDRFKANFDSGVCPIAQVPLASDENKHVEDPMRNAGEVIGLERVGRKIYDLIDIRDPEVARRIKDGRIMGASAMLSLDYRDTRTNAKAGPALLHHCLTNRPYVTDLDDYEEVLAASADYTGDAVVLAQEELRMTREELIAALKDEHGIDVDALQEQVSQRTDMSQLTAMLTEALRPASGTLQLTGGTTDETVTLGDVIGAVAELAEKNVSLTGTVGELRKDAAEREVDGYVGNGRLLPKTREYAVRLVLSGDRDGLDAILAPENAPYVKLNHVEGAAPPQGEQRHTGDIDAEIAKLTAEHSEFFTDDGNRGGSRRPR